MEKTLMTAEEVLKRARPISGKKTEVFDAMENIPTLAIGEDIVAGQTLAGIYVETQVLASPKFTYSQERNDKGIPVQRLHVLENGGVKFGIWNCGELKQIFARLPPGTYLELTYDGKGKNSKDQDQHNFSVKREVPVAQ